MRLPQLIPCALFFCLGIPGLIQADEVRPTWVNDGISAEAINHAFGLRLFDKPSLWDEDDAILAKRLRWPEESRTRTLSSYRLYTTVQKSVKIFGCRAYSCALYAENKRPTEISLVFINEGDFKWIDSMQKPPPDDPDALDFTDPNPSSAGKPAGPATNDDPNADLIPKTKTLDQISVDSAADKVGDAVMNWKANYAKAMDHDSKTIETALTTLFGEPQHKTYGDTQETTEQVLRWDWRGHSILFCRHQDRYVTVRILPTAVLNGEGRVNNISAEEWKKLLLSRVETCPNGDVKILDIPMVDQGPKGYCVPATWQRVMRYLGMPADLYVLAMAAQTSGVEGTNVETMIKSVTPLIKKYGHSIQPQPLTMPTLKQNIDSGMPLIWCCEIYEPFDESLTARSQLRTKVQDWEAWKAQTRKWSQESRDLVQNNNEEGGHQRLITGYNFQTGELCISDSWGKEARERWMTLFEAARISKENVVFVITP